jgi:hypothetical protein
MAKGWGQSQYRLALHAGFVFSAHSLRVVKASEFTWENTFDASGLRLPSHPDAVQWLRDYYASGNRLNGSSANAAAAPSPADDSLSSSEDAALQGHLTIADSSTSSSRGTRLGGVATGIPHSKPNLVVAPVGDRWNASIWLSEPSRATFDVIAIYHGDHPERFRCTHAHVQRVDVGRV